MSGEDEQVDIDHKTKAVFDRKGYEVMNKISQGAYGKVYKARRTKDGTLSAVKVMDKSKMDPTFVKVFLPRELHMLQKIRHPHVLKVHDIFQSKGKIWIFMEFAPNGILTKRCMEKPIPERKAKKWFRQCAEALHYMHDTLNICHRDIKTDNVLLDKNDNAKLSDYGFAREIKSEDGMTKTVCGTLPYYSPELLRASYKQTPYGGYHADNWAMGVMLYIMLTSKWPFKANWNRINLETLRVLIQNQFDRVYNARREFTELSEGARHLIDHLLDPNPEKRYTSKKMLKHAWLAH